MGDKQMAEALVIKAKADVRGNWPDAAKDSLNEAMAIFDKYGNEAGLEKCGLIDDEIQISRGLPTRAQLAEMRRREQERMQLMQQQMLMQQQGQFQMPQQHQWQQNAWDQGPAP